MAQQPFHNSLSYVTCLFSKGRIVDILGLVCQTVLLSQNKVASHVSGKLVNFPGQRPEAPGSGKIEDSLGNIQSFIGRATKM